MAINKVVYGNQTLMDLTSDDLTAGDLILGKTAHDRSGSPIVGSLVIPAINVDLENPDVNTQYAITRNSSQNFPVNQKPRFVFVYTRNSGGNYVTYTCIYDIENDKGVLMSIGDNNIITVSTTVSAIFGPITDSYVNIKNNSSSYTRYTRLLAWY